MNDYSELKRMAEAFPADLDWDSNTEPFFNGPSGESLGGGADGTYTVYGKPFRIEDEDYDYDGPTYVERCGVDFAKFMVSARDGVLALIAENETIKAQFDECARLFVDATEQACQARRERDQLKADNEALRKALRSAEDAMWKAESSVYNEAAELHALLAALSQGEPAPGTSLISIDSCMICGSMHGGLPCPNMTPMATDGKDG